MTKTEKWIRKFSNYSQISIISSISEIRDKKEVGSPQK